MNEIIAIASSTIGNQQVNTVNARDLHSFLQVGKDFSNWIKAQIERARLVDGRDYLLAQKGEQLPSGTKWLKEYHLTIEAGKHIAMLSGTEKGFEVREYFIECERQAKAAAPAFTLPTNFKEALLQLVEQVEANEQMQLTIQAQAPKVAFADTVSSANNCVHLGSYAKAISDQSGVVVGRNTMFAILKNLGILDRKNMPNQRYIDAGWFKVKEGTYENINSNGPRVCFTTMITGKGQVALYGRIMAALGRDVGQFQPTIGGVQ